MQCPTCRNIIPPSVSYCAYCGAAARAVVAPLSPPARAISPRPIRTLASATGALPAKLGAHWGVPNRAIWLAVTVVLALSGIAVGAILITRSGSQPLLSSNSTLVGMPSELAVLQDRAGLTAYVNTERQIDLKFGAFSEVVAWDDDFALGRIALPSDFRVGWSDVYGKLPPNVEHIRDVHVFIHRSGWIAAYYPKQNRVTDNVIPVNFGFSLSEDILDPLRVGLDRALDSVGLETGEGSSASQVHYFDFSHPNDDALSLVTARATGHGQNNFSFTIPEGVHVSSASWYHSTHNVDSMVSMDGKQVSKGQGVGSASSAVLYARGIHRGEMNAKRLSPGAHEVSFRLSNLRPSGIAFFVLALSHSGQVAILNSDATIDIIRLESPLHESSQNMPQSSAVGSCFAQPVDGTPQTTIQFAVEVEPYQEEFRYIWDLGDGQSVEGSNVSHRYDKPGVYRPVVRAIDREGREVPWIHTTNWVERQACPTAWVSISAE